MIRRVLCPLAALLILGGLLEIWASYAPGALPAPSAVLSELLQGWSKYCWASWHTFSAALVGYFMANTAAALLAVVLASRNLIHDAVMPLAVALKATPVLALGALIYRVAGGGFWSISTAAGMVCFFPVLVVMTRGIRDIEPGWIDLARTSGANSFRMLLLVRLPATIVPVSDALRVSAPLAIVGAMVGEMTMGGRTYGLGAMVTEATMNYKTIGMVAAVSLGGVGGCCLYYTVTLAVRWLAPWAVQSKGM